MRTWSIETVSEQSYRDYMVENIFEPLNMTSTDIVYSDVMVEQEATGTS